MKICKQAPGDARYTHVPFCIKPLEHPRVQVSLIFFLKNFSRSPGTGMLRVRASWHLMGPLSPQLASDPQSSCLQSLRRLLAMQLELPAGRSRWRESGYRAGALAIPHMDRSEPSGDSQTNTPMFGSQRSPHADARILGQPCESWGSEEEDALVDLDTQSQGGWRHDDEVEEGGYLRLSWFTQQLLEHTCELEDVAEQEQAEDQDAGACHAATAQEEACRCRCDEARCGSLGSSDDVRRTLVVDGGQTRGRRPSRQPCGVAVGGGSPSCREPGCSLSLSWKLEAVASWLAAKRPLSLSSCHQGASGSGMPASGATAARGRSGKRRKRGRRGLSCPVRLRAPATLDLDGGGVSQQLQEIAAGREEQEEQAAEAEATEARMQVLRDERGNIAYAFS